MAAAVYTVAELADLLGVSDWSLYNCVKNGTSPVPPIKVGHRIVFAKAAVDRLLQLEEA
jgi:excisionase family DNA binding protein